MTERPQGELAVTVVVGPPCAGKSTYVAEHYQPGDLIVDYDRLAVALSGLDEHTQCPRLIGYVEAAREAVLDRIVERWPGTEPQRAWVTTSHPDHVVYYGFADRLRADVVLLDVDADECLRRLRVDPDGRDISFATRGIEAWRNR